jgi:hypothetical protein
LGETTYRLSTASRISLNKAPEYQDVGVSINEALDGDYFEIYGSYDNDNQEFDNYIDNMISKGKSLRLEYHVSLYEENILINTNIFSITENYTQKVLYRPIITFSNTTALIDVELRIIDNPGYQKKFPKFLDISEIHGLEGNIEKLIEYLDTNEQKLIKLEKERKREMEEKEDNKRKISSDNYKNKNYVSKKIPESWEVKGWQKLKDSKKNHWNIDRDFIVRDIEDMLDSFAEGSPNDLFNSYKKDEGKGDDEKTKEHLKKFYTWLQTN